MHLLASWELINGSLHILNWSRFSCATKSLRCVWGQWKKLHMQKRKWNERKLHNQKSQQAVINGPYIFSSCLLLCPPPFKYLVSLPLEWAHTRENGQRSKQVPEPCEKMLAKSRGSFGKHLARMRPHAAFWSWVWMKWSLESLLKASCLSLKQQTLNLRLGICIFNCMRHANIDQAN